ncbi:hypothetical protein J6590_008553 [Homalodisca vitripennis]|nr:hypothetical protein J6590_008553 [Homalodisca vitripennis]
MELKNSTLGFKKKFQLMDLMGAAQTIGAHEAALKVLNFKSEESLDLNERYLWSLSLGSHPVSDVVKDLVRLMEAGPYNEKLDETLVLTIAATTNNLKKHNGTSNEKV